MNHIKVTKENIHEIPKLASIILPETYESIMSLNQINYILKLYYQEEAIINQIENNYNFEIIYENNYAIGFFSYKIFNDFLQLDSIYILNKYQNKGILKKVIKYLEEKFNKPYIEIKISKYNISLEYFKKINFIITNDKTTNIGQGYYLSDYIMQKKIEDKIIENKIINPKKSIFLSLILGLIGTIPEFFYLIGFGEVNALCFIFIPIMVLIGFKIGKSNKQKYIYYISIILFLFTYIISYLIFFIACCKLNNSSFFELFKIDTKLKKDFLITTCYSLIYTLTILLIYSLFKKKKD